MFFKGKVLDEFGEPLVGAHVITVFDSNSRGTITDFDGIFIIGDARSGENWKIGHLGYEDIFFSIPRNGGERTFTMKEKAFELEGVTVTPNRPTTTFPVAQTGDFPERFEEIMQTMPVKKRKGLLETLAENPVAAIGFGLLAFFGISAIASQMARKSDEMASRQKETA